MKNLSIISICTLLALGACDRPATPATQPPTRSAAPALQAVDIRTGIYTARIDEHITITPDGSLRRVFRMGVNYGPDDNPGSTPQVEIRQGQLSAAQMAELVQLFAGWERLSDSYPAVPDGPEVVFRYGKKEIRGGGFPEQVRKASATIREFAQSMPRLNPTTRATQAASP